MKKRSGKPDRFFVFQAGNEANASSPAVAILASKARKAIPLNKGEYGRVCSSLFPESSRN